MPRLLLCSLALALALAACDANETADADIPWVWRTDRIADLDVNFPMEEPVEIPLGPHFSSRNTTAVTYTAASNNAAVTVAVEGDVLTLRATAGGGGSVRVVARGTEGGQAADTFAVRITGGEPPPEPPDGVCPPGREAGDGDFFPIAAGRTWTYRYAYTYNPPCLPYSHSRAGEITLALHTVTCSAGRRTATGEIERHLTQIVRGWNTPPDTTTIDDALPFQIVETAEYARILGLEEELPFSRFPVPRYRSARPNTVSVSMDYGTNTYVRGIGLTGRSPYHGSCGYGWPMESLSLLSWAAAPETPDTSSSWARRSAPSASVTKEGVLGFTDVGRFLLGPLAQLNAPE